MPGQCLSQAYNTSNSNAQREEVRSVKYEKPQIQAAPDAVSFIQGGKHGLPMDSFETSTPAAYEADE
jgi:hypothetical protein